MLGMFGRTERQTDGECKECINQADISLYRLRQATRILHVRNTVCDKENLPTVTKILHEYTDLKPYAQLQEKSVV